MDSFSKWISYCTNLLWVFIGLFVVWIVSYGLIHSRADLHQGNLILLSAQDIEQLIAIQKSMEEERVEAKLDTMNEPEKSLMVARFEKDEKSKIVDYLHGIRIKPSAINDLTVFYSDLSKRPFEKKSYFFLKDDYVLLEILFWALMGVICNSMFHISEFIRKRTYKRREAVVYLVKVFYAPVITLIIYLGLSLLGTELGTLPNPGNTIVLSFVLGFFSGRAIDLLHRLKDVLIPGSPQSDKVDPADAFKALSQNEQKRIVNALIEKEAVNLKAKYPKIQDMSARPKTGQKSNFYCLHIDVSEKRSLDQLINPIPAYLPFTDSSGEQYQIPTEVIRQSTTDLIAKAATLDMVDELIDQEYNNWKAQYAFKQAMAALKMVQGSTTETACVQFTVEKKDRSDKKQIPSFFTFNGIEIPTDIIEEGVISADAPFFKPGQMSKRGGTKGTFGLKVYRESSDKSKEYFALGCYHTFCSPELGKGLKTFTVNTAVGDTSLYAGGKKIGNVFEGYLDKRIDAALCSLDKPDDMGAEIEGFAGFPTDKTKTINNGDISARYGVSLHGAVSQDQFGHVTALCRQPINVDIGGVDYEFQHVIRTSKISTHGDSGTIVVDNFGAVVGLLFASSDIASYVIPIATITVKLKINICHA